MKLLFDTSLRRVNRLQAGHLRHHGFTASGASNFSLFPVFRPGHGPTQLPCQWVPGTFHWTYSGCGMQVTPDPHLALQLRMTALKPPFLHMPSGHAYGQLYYFEVSMEII